MVEHGGLGTRPGGQPFGHGDQVAALVRRSRPPGAVTVAAVTTIVLSSVVLALSGFGLLMLLLAGNLIIDNFEGSDTRLHLWVDAAVVLAGLWSLVATGLGFRVLRRRGPWGLVASSGAAAIVSAVAAHYAVYPAVVTLGAVVVLMLLLRPASRAWFREG